MLARRVLTHRELTGSEPEVGDTWEVCTINEGPNPGSYVVLLKEDGWALEFHRFSINGREVPPRRVAHYGPGDEAERAIRQLGRNVCKDIRKEVKLLAAPAPLRR